MRFCYAKEFRTCSTRPARRIERLGRSPDAEAGRSIRTPRWGASRAEAPGDAGSDLRQLHSAGSDERRTSARSTSSAFPRARPRGGPRCWSEPAREPSLFESDAERKNWELTDTWFLGSVVHHIVMDPRDERTVLATVRSGHLGPTILRSEDGGQEVARGAATTRLRRGAAGWPGATDGQPRLLADARLGRIGAGDVVRRDFAAGALQAAPMAVRTWKPVNGLNHHPELDRWTGGEQDGTPDGPKLHSVDRRPPRWRRTSTSACRAAACFESTDAGAPSWSPLNAGCEADFLVAARGRPRARVRPRSAPRSSAARTNPDRTLAAEPLRRLPHGSRGREVDSASVRPCRRTSVTSASRSSSSPFDPDTAWVFPMDGTDVWPRTSPGGSPAVYRHPGRRREPGRDRTPGFPREHAWWTVKRQCMAQDQHDPLGLYLGTSSGEVWASIAGRQALEEHRPSLAARLFGRGRGGRVSQPQPVVG